MHMRLQHVGKFASRPPIELRAPYIVVVGAGPAAQIRLKATGIADAQALLVCENSGAVVRHIGPVMATLVNGRPIKEAALHPGDALQIGPFAFRYECDQPPASSDPPEGQLEPQDWSDAILLRDRVTLLGSAAHCDGVLTGDGVAAVHAAVIRSDSGILVRALGGETTVNGKPVRQHRLAAADVIQIGSSAFKYAPAAPTSQTILRPAAASRFKRKRAVLPDNKAISQAMSAPEMEAQPEHSAQQPAARPGRGRTAALLLMMGLCMAAAAFGIWRYLPVRYIVEASMAFEQPNRGAGGNAPEAQVKEFLRQQELILIGEELRSLAMAKLRLQRTKLEPDFLARPAELGRRAQIRYDIAPDVARIVVSVRGTDSSADAARLNALLSAFHGRASGRSADVGALREQLLGTEVVDLEKEIGWRVRLAEQLRKDLKTAEADAPAAAQLEQTTARVETLRRSLESAIESRALAQRDSGDAQALARAKAAENKIRGELAQADDQLSRAAKAGLQSEDRRQRLAEVSAQSSALEKSFSEKREELDRVRRDASPRLQPRPPESAHVVASEDPRGLYIAGAVAALSMVFILLSAGARRNAARSS
jgi:pSer/pThr/pTyr-binding forkhead associated (FHA) protein